VGTEVTERGRLIAAAGECGRCHEQATERVAIRLVQGNSGPGWTQYGCLPCARHLARSQFAPRWLRDDVAILDAPEPRHLRSVE
jgi:hypothetical protein